MSLIMDFLKENKISRSSVDDTIRNLLEFMNSISINLIEKGRKFFPVLCFALRSFSEGGSSVPLPARTFP